MVRAFNQDGTAFLSTCPSSESFEARITTNIQVYHLAFFVTTVLDIFGKRQCTNNDEEDDLELLMKHILVNASALMMKKTIWSC
jgi:hypothetical protein